MNIRNKDIQTDINQHGMLFLNYVRGDDPKARELSNQYFGDNQKPINSAAIDENWLTGRFVQGEYKNKIGPGRYFTTSAYKFTTTGWGGHISINPKPQYTRYADIRHPAPGRDDVTFYSTSGDHGMGRVYSEAIDDNAQLVYMQFGKPRFNGLLDYLMSAIDYRDTIVANTGRVPYLYNIGAFVGGFAMLACFPLIFTTVWLLKMGKQILAGQSSFDYYYMQPDMVGYWNTVAMIATAIGTETHLVPLVFDPESASEPDKMGIKTSIDAEAAQQLNDLVPGLISKHGYIDVFKIVTATQAKALAYNTARKEMIEKNSLLPLININGYTNIDLSKIQNARMLTSLDNVSEEVDYVLSGEVDSVDFNEYAKKVIINGPLGKSDESTAPDPDKYETPNSDADNENKEVSQEDKNKLKNAIKAGENTADKEGHIRDRSQNLPNKKSWLSEFWTSLKSSATDGGHYAVFTVEFNGTSTSSFSNSVGDIETGTMLKTVAVGARSAKFNIAGGNLGMGIDLGSIAGAGKELLMGGLEKITFGLSNVLATVLGDARVDIQKKWNDSSVTLPTASFTIKLRSPYGNPISQMQNLWIPLSMLLASVLPLSTGKASYTSPYLCSAFSQGVCNIKLGMVTDLSITTGTTNLAYTRDRRPLGIDVNFTITDFSNLITAPVNSNVFNVLSGDSAATFGISIDDGTTLGRYLATLAGRDFNTNKYTKNTISQRLTKMFANWEGFFSPSRLGYIVGDIVNPIIAPFWFVPQGDFDPKTPTHMRLNVNNYGH